MTTRRPMLSNRTRRRLVRHHLVLGLVTAAALVTVYLLVPSADPTFRWSMATGYVGLAALGATFATGPLNVLRRRANLVSTDLRRDLGVWAGLLAIAHFVVGLQVHMLHRWLYFLREVEDGAGLALRGDLFGAANYTRLLAVLVAALLLVLSNDRSLRARDAAVEGPLQRWNYALFVLTVVHAVAYQVVEERTLPFVVLLAALAAATMLVQLAGYVRRRAESHRPVGASGSAPE